MNTSKKRVAGLIVNEGKLLLVSGYDADFYWTPGGKPNNSSEDLYTALIRELQEELGILITKDALQEYFTYISEEKSGDSFEVHNFLVNYSGEIKTNQEIDNTLWLSKNTFRENPRIVEKNIAENLITKLIDDEILY
ncbi:MAG: hypothetical protein BRC24_01960 [Parcubacteria group bacterium SW_4_46_8]|nr:MAG: hypothetical protein BRC24_01960 [Parcubacteria group bacterium SW_4_46_8]